MSLRLYYHPLSLFCHKVLVALYENETPFEKRLVDFGDAEAAAELGALWPPRQFPVLCDGDRVLPETSVIIEYLDLHHPGPRPLVPTDREQALDVRRWDRFFDLHVAVKLNVAVLDRIKPEGRRDPIGAEDAKAALTVLYGVLEAQLDGKAWVTGDAFTMADCAGSTALFYAGCIQPFGQDFPRVSAYFDRLRARPSFARVLDEARPYFEMFPYYDQMPAHLR